MIIIGGGIAGLSAALEAEKSGHRTLLLEASNKLGGRVKSDLVDGFTLDHGFQVLLSNYSMAQRVIRFNKLDLKAFAPGAHITDDRGKLAISDPMREPSAYVTMLFSRVGSISDKLRLRRLSSELKSLTEAQCFDIEQTTMDYLRDYGFSERMIALFFKPFFGGVFLESNLSTSAGMFRFVFRNFAIGEACIPAKGMQAIPDDMAQRLKNVEVRLNAVVKTIHANQDIELLDGTIFAAKKIILACDPSRLLPQMDQPIAYNSTRTEYFSGKAELKKLEKRIGLDARSISDINNYCRLDEVQSSYAPKGRSLWSVSLRQNSKAQPAAVSAQLAELIGANASDLTPLKSYEIKKALPILENPTFDIPAEQSQIASHIYLAGDYLLNASIEGALRSGYRAAEACIETLELV